ncbi:MAG: LacI family DNA-binding transcriptional regulator [Marinilabiliaceae bacterium]
MARATLSRVAREAGVSKTTASLVINGKADQVNIAVSTRERVLETARTLNYRPARFVPGRLNGRTGLILVVAPGFSEPALAGWLHHVIIAAEKRGYTVVPRVMSTGDEENVWEIPADGIVFLGENVVPADMKNGDIPCVCAGFHAHGKNIQAVVPDYKQQINELISGLYRCNKKAIGFLAEDSEASEKRLNVYRENYCERFGIPPNTEQLYGKYDEKSVIEGVKRLVEKGANSIILETVEMTIKGFSSSRIRNMAAEGVVFATCGDHPAFDLLPERMLIRAIEDKGAMADEVLKNLTGL